MLNFENKFILKFNTHSLLRLHLIWKFFIMNFGNNLYLARINYVIFQHFSTRNNFLQTSHRNIFRHTNSKLCSKCFFTLSSTRLQGKKIWKNSSRKWNRWSDNYPNGNSHDVGSNRKMRKTLHKTCNRMRFLFSHKFYKRQLLPSANQGESNLANNRSFWRAATKCVFHKIYWQQILLREESNTIIHQIISVENILCDKSK